MREPDFWWRPGTGSLLAPAAAIYGAVARARLQAGGSSVGVPVICLGNLTIGGGGKTPAALAVGRLLVAGEARPFFLSRGYGGRLAGPVRVDLSVHSAGDVGDEPLLLSRLAPTIVARDRLAGAKAARAAGVIVMDDGFQNPSLKKDLSILVVDGRRGIGNGRVIPAGPLRAPLDVQLARAQALIVIGPANDDAAAAAAAAAAVAEAARRLGVAIFRGRLEPDRDGLAAIGTRRVLAFAGIADPEKFYATLETAGIGIAARMSFHDHHRYTAAEAQTLIAAAAAGDLILLTTEKDHVRLRGDPELAALAARVKAFPVQLVVEPAEAFERLVLGAAKRP
jgi:tetraacyldisaccharide 4'-kinase